MYLNIRSLVGRRGVRTRGRRMLAMVVGGALAVTGLTLGAPAQGSAQAATVGSGSTRAAYAASRSEASITPVTSCEALAGKDLTRVEGAPARVLSVATVTSNGAAFCEVKGYIAPQLQFTVRLPETTWTGAYVQQGCGGFCGSIVPGPPLTATGCARVAGNELVLATDNEGHLGASEADGLWASADPSLRVTMGYTSEHQLALTTKALVSAYYGRGPSHSYFDGCSDGGREALDLAQRYPHDFDGILAGAPAGNWAALLGEFEAWVIRANTGADGRQVLPAEKLPALHAAVLKACAGPDGYITDPRSCDFHPADMRCSQGTDTDSCLTSAQVTAVERIYQGPADQQGDALYPGGEPYGSELAWSGWLVDSRSDTTWPADAGAYQLAINYLKYMAYDKNPPASFTLDQVRFDKAGYRKLMRLAGLYDATSPDLSAFARAGGKIIIYHGWADQAIPPTGTVDYYKAVVRHAGGFGASQAFSRLYMIPGQYHCLSGGDPAVTGDLLTSLMSWVEQGQSPGDVSFPLVKPTDTLKQIDVSPMNPLTPPSGGTAPASDYHWIGTFPTAAQLWCTIGGMSIACDRRTDRQ
ncbi:tannase/feruloyl esterase family alpha/beta hydrolase [Streptomyces humi]